MESIQKRLTAQEYYRSGSLSKIFQEKDDEEEELNGQQYSTKKHKNHQEINNLINNNNLNHTNLPQALNNSTNPHLQNKTYNIKNKQETTFDKPSKSHVKPAVYYSFEEMLKFFKLAYDIDHEKFILKEENRPEFKAKANEFLKNYTMYSFLYKLFVININI